jgi:predicted GIY-YIG superfamily endonuclease
MIIQIRPLEGKFQIRVLNKPPKRLVGIMEYVEREEVEERVKVLQEGYRARGQEVVLDDWTPLNSSVYVIHLGEDAKQKKKMKEQNNIENPRGVLYVGMTGLPIQERVANHLRGHKSCSLVKKYFQGVFLEKCETSLLHEEAKTRERELAEELRREGYWVYQN